MTNLRLHWLFAIALTLWASAPTPAAAQGGTASPPGSPPAAPTPCATRPESKQFDFWVGEWDVTSAKGTHAGTSSVRKILGDCVVFENWTDARGSQGKSLNAYNAGLGMWQQFWTSQTGNVTEYRHSEWVDGSLRFTAHVPDVDSPNLLRMTFTPIDSNTVRQWGQSSADGGKTWKPTFDLYYHRRK